MKIFNRTKEFPQKVNFVDEENVVLGYDLEQACCESAGWFISDSLHSFPGKDDNDVLREHPASYQPGSIYDMEGWNFDKNFRAAINHVDLYDGKMVVFRIKKDGLGKFVHIFNSHNGFYSHGFSFSGPNFITVDDSI